ncbi:MAG: hypothetical protein LIP09_11940 [Bacteroidales bacterium]|nr:hypothetical protein [Bacteroidales bacterium]
MHSYKSASGSPYRFGSASNYPAGVSDRDFDRDYDCSDEEIEEMEERADYREGEYSEYCDRQSDYWL